MGRVIRAARLSCANGFGSIRIVIAHGSAKQGCDCVLSGPRPRLVPACEAPDGYVDSPEVHLEVTKLLQGWGFNVLHVPRGRFYFIGSLEGINAVFKSEFLQPGSVQMHMVHNSKIPPQLTGDIVQCGIVKIHGMCAFTWKHLDDLQDQGALFVPEQPRA